jgi:hypothetical protein
MARPGVEYVLYLLYAGVFRLKMDESTTFESYLISGTNQLPENYLKQKIRGSSMLRFSCPESFQAVPSYSDWVLYLKKSSN